MNGKCLTNKLRIMRQDFTDYCKEQIENRLPEMEGSKVWMSELGFQMLEGPNVDGTLTYSTHEAIEYIREWWYDAADYFQYEKDNFGEVYHNPFENPEAYMVCMVIEGVRSILSQCETVDEQWNDAVELTGTVIDRILSEVKDVEEVKW